VKHLAAAAAPPPLPQTLNDSLAELAYELTVIYGICMHLVTRHGHQVPVRASPRPERSRLSDELTAAEHRIARMIAAGASNRDIAEWLVISPKTVEAHLSRIYRKLGVRCRVDLTRLVISEPADG
jgi:DNA-binding NarL/FixJ family response regulator